MADALLGYSRAMNRIGEPVTIHFEPRNEGQEWTVSLASDPMLHEHFPSLGEGLNWLADRVEQVRQ